MLLKQYFKTKIQNFYFSKLSLFYRTFYDNCAVLLYHRVTDINTDPQLLSVKPQNFDQHIALIKKKYTLLQIDELRDCLVNQKKIPKNSVVLTFDDGYADNYLEALPILEKHNAQALFYISTGTLNTTNEFWWDAIERIILLSDVRSIPDKFEINGEGLDLTDLNAEKKNKIYEFLMRILRRLPLDEREKKIAILAQMFDSQKGRVTHRAMTFDELKLMNSSKSAVIGAHTHSHPLLSALTYDQQLEEIQTSKIILEKQLGQPISHFAFPFGNFTDFSNDTISICKKIGFEMVAAAYSELLNKKSNLFSFPRFGIHNWNIERFEKELDRILN